MPIPELNKRAECIEARNDYTAWLMKTELSAYVQANNSNEIVVKKIK